MPHAQIPLEYSGSSTESSQSLDYHVAFPLILSRDSAGPGIEENWESFSVFNENLEDISYWQPTMAYLLPVTLPTTNEPSLYELLHRATGREDLECVESVKLRVISDFVSLSRLSNFLPRLSHLDLSGSVLTSLRDLGLGFEHLIYLNVSNCGLSSFDGTSGLPKVEVIIADNNMVQLVGALAGLVPLKKLSARNNRINDLHVLTFLGLCPNLIEVDLQGNPVTNFVLYRSTMQRNVKQLELLDGLPFNADDRAVSVARSEEDNSKIDTPTSSLSDEMISDLSEHGSFCWEEVSITESVRSAAETLGNELLISLPRQRGQRQGSCSSSSSSLSLGSNSNIRFLPPLKIRSKKMKDNSDISSSSDAVDK